MKLDVSSLAHTKWECKYHIVFAPKYRRQIIYGKIKQDIGQMLRKLCEYKGMAAQTFPVTPEKLEAEAAAIARRQNTTVAELKRFLGEDLAMLQSDLKKRKAAAWACEQMAAAG